jgi:hypothetical protein
VAGQSIRSLPGKDRLQRWHEHAVPECGVPERREPEPAAWVVDGVERLHLVVGCRTR